MQVSVHASIIIRNFLVMIGSSFVHWDLDHFNAHFVHDVFLDFPMTRGRRHVADVPNWSHSHCQTVQFDPLSFYPDKHVHVQISVSHVNGSGQVHEAAVSWVEDVSDSHFTFCVMESGRNEGPPHGFASVEYMAYQGAPKGALAGSVLIPEWWTGSKCQRVNISSVRTNGMDFKNNSKRYKACTLNPLPNSNTSSFVYYALNLIHQ